VLAETLRLPPQVRTVKYFKDLRQIIQKELGHDH
jgi:hypothetical protein